jgi:hypothetical protein
LSRDGRKLFKAQQLAEWFQQKLFIFNDKDFLHGKSLSASPTTAKFSWMICVFVAPV